MKTRRKRIPTITLRQALKHLIAEYRNFDSATRLCADYCITAEEIAALTAETMKRKESRPTFAMQSDNTSGEAYLTA